MQVEDSTTGSEPTPATGDGVDTASEGSPSLGPADAPSATPEPFPTAVPTATATPIPVHTLSQTEREAIAIRFIEVLATGDYEGAAGHFDDTVREALPPDELKDLWTRLTEKAGEYLAVESVSESDVQFHKLLVIEALFQTFVVDFRFTFDVDGRIAGLFFGASRPTEGFPVPDYADEDAFTESDVIVGGGGDWRLPGTLTLPLGQGPFPVVILVHGYGRQDRDATFGLVKPFRDLAWGLATREVAVLRYEKRTFAYRDQFLEMAASFTLADDTVDDALAAVDLLGRIGRVDPDRIFVLGHSLGGYAIPRIAARTEGVAGYILLAGAARPIPELRVEQLEYIATLDGAVTPDERAAIDDARAAAVCISAKVSCRFHELLVIGLGPAYLLDLDGYDPADEARAMEAPMLILQGGSDYQVTVQDYRLWRDALAERHNVEFELYPGLNHFFVEIDGQSTPDDVLNPANISQRVIDDIAAWVAER